MFKMLTVTRSGGWGKAKNTDSLDFWWGWNPKLLTVPRTSKDNRRNAKETIEF